MHSLLHLVPVTQNTSSWISCADYCFENAQVGAAFAFLGLNRTLAVFTSFLPVMNASIPQQQHGRSSTCVAIMACLLPDISLTNVGVSSNITVVAGGVQSQYAD